MLLILSKYSNRMFQLIIKNHINNINKWCQQQQQQQLQHQLFA